MSQISFEDFKAKLINYDATYRWSPDRIVRQMYEDKHVFSLVPDEVPSSIPVKSPISYHLWLDEAAKGPFTIGQLRAMWNSGQITAETSYTGNAGESWCPLSDIVSELEPAPVPVAVVPQIVPRVVQDYKITTHQPERENGASKFLAFVLFLITAVLAGAGFINLQPTIQEDTLQKSINDTTPALQTVDQALDYGETRGINVSQLRDKQTEAKEKLNGWKDELKTLQTSQSNTVVLCFIGAGVCLLAAFICVGISQSK